MATDSFDPKSKIIAAKFAAERDMPFLGRILYAMELIPIEPDSWHYQFCKTACVDDRGRLWWSPEFIEGLSLKEVGGLMAHEVFHLADEHHRRGANRSYGHLWVLATELKADWFTAASGLLLPLAFVEHGVYVKGNTGYLNIGDGDIIAVPDVDKQAVEQIYAFLLREEEKEEEKEENNKEDKNKTRQKLKDLASKVEDMISSGTDGEESGSGDGSSAGKQIPSGVEIGDLKGLAPEDMRELVKAAKEDAARRGTLPGSMNTWLKTGTFSETNWRKVLAEAFSPLHRGHRSFKKPHKRSQSIGFALPGHTKDGARLVIHIDTSGSVLGCIGMFYSEIRAIVGSWTKVSVDILLCDCGSISENDSIHISSVRDLPEKLNVNGMGGGTSHRPVVTWVNEHASEAKVLVSLTDGYSDIEHCYRDLPMSMRKVLVLPMSSYYYINHLSPYCDNIVTLPEK